MAEGREGTTPASSLFQDAAQMRERLLRVVDEADKSLGGRGGYPPSYKWTDAFIEALAADGLRLIDWEGCACERREKLIEEAMRDDGPEHGCAACEGDPEAHDLHVCGRDNA